MTAVPLRIPRAFYVDAAAAPGTPGGWLGACLMGACRGARLKVCLWCRCSSLLLVFHRTCVANSGNSPLESLPATPALPPSPCSTEADGFGQAVKRILPGGLQPMHTYHVRAGGRGRCMHVPQPTCRCNKWSMATCLCWVRSATPARPLGFHAGDF